MLLFFPLNQNPCTSGIPPHTKMINPQKHFFLLTILLLLLELPLLMSYYCAFHPLATSFESFPSFPSFLVIDLSFFSVFLISYSTLFYLLGLIFCPLNSYSCFLTHFDLVFFVILIVLEFASNLLLC
jgi:hypothetical protein